VRKNGRKIEEIEEKWIFDTPLIKYGV